MFPIGVLLSLSCCVDWACAGRVADSTVGAGGIEGTNRKLPIRLMLSLCKVLEAFRWRRPAEEKFFYSIHLQMCSWKWLSFVVLREGALFAPDRYVRGS